MGAGCTGDVESTLQHGASGPGGGQLFEGDGAMFFEAGALALAIAAVLFVGVVAYGMM